MLKRYIKDIVKNELTKQKLNDIYGLARSYNLNSVSDKERQELNEEISILKNYHNNMVERNKYLKLEISKLRRENETLKQDSEELKMRYNKISEENKQLKDYREIDFKASLHSGFQSEDLKQQNEKLKQENKQLKNLSCSIVIDNDGKIDSLFNQELKQENEKLKKENEILQGSYNFISNNIVSELESRVTSKERIATEINLMLNKEKQENEKLKIYLKKSNDYVKSLEHEISELKKSLEKQTSYRTIDYNATLQIGSDLENSKQENEKLKKELLDSKNGLNGANDIIKNMKQENQKLKDENNLLKQQNAKSNLVFCGNNYEKQVLEDKLSRIYKTIEDNYYQDGYYELLRIKNIIADILKES